MHKGPQPEDTPPTLYRYREFESESHLNTIEKGTFWFAHADSFNDPFDVNWGFDYSGTTEEKVQWARDHFLKREMSHLSEKERDRRARERIEEIERDQDFEDWIRERHVQMNKEKFGICSLSSKRDDILMWSHYSNDHSGFCVGIDTEMLEEVQRRRAEKGVTLELCEVDYQETIPEINFYESTRGDWRQDVLRFVTTKSDHWGYEEEYRLLLYDRPSTAYPLGIEVISEVILGCEVADEHREEMLSIVDDRPGVGISVYQAEKHDQRYELTLKTVREGQ
jgi:hypothetical protein